MTRDPPTYRKIVAIVRRARLPAVEERLCREGVPGLTVSPVKGFGDYADAFCKDLLVPHVRIDIYLTESDVERLVAAIVEAGHTGEPGDGFIAVEPVLAMTHIGTGVALTTAHLQQPDPRGPCR